MGNHKPRSITVEIVDRNRTIRRTMCRTLGVIIIRRTTTIVRLPRLLLLFIGTMCRREPISINWIIITTVVLICSIITLCGAIFYHYSCCKKTVPVWVIVISAIYSFSIFIFICIAITYAYQNEHLRQNDFWTKVPLSKYANSLD